MSAMIPYTSQVPVIPIDSLQNSLNTFIEAVQSISNAKTARTRIIADKEIQLQTVLSDMEVQIKRIDAENQRGMEEDRRLHEERMEILRAVNQLLTNADKLSPETMEAAKMLISVLQGYQ